MIVVRRDLAPWPCPDRAGDEPPHAEAVTVVRL
jgi:hypothetical protein